MNKILFVSLYDFTKIKKSQPPLGLMSLKVLLNKKSEWEAQICDFNEVYYRRKLKDIDLLTNIENMVEYALNYRADIISIYTMCDIYHIALLLAKRIKEKSPFTTIILAGPHATMVAQDTLSEFDYVDYIALGEGEDTIVNNLNGIRDGNFEHVKGLGYREKDGGIVIKWDRFESYDINNLEFIDIGEVGNYNDDMKEVEIEGGRGCPFRCAFCSTQMFWGNNFRVKRLDIIMKEIKYYMKKYNTKVFSIQHDLFTFNKKYILEFCDTLINEKYNIKWKCSARLDVLDEEMVAKMAQSGCMGVFFGIETGSKTVQKKVNKNLKLEKFDTILKAMLKNNMSGIWSFIYGFPMEEDEDLNDTLKLIYHIKQEEVKSNSFVDNFIALWPISFLPGTKLGQEYLDELVFNENRGMDFNNSVYSKGEETLDMVKQHKNIFLSYYNIKKNTGKEFQCLNTFIMFLFNYLYKHIYNSIDHLIEYYDHNILKLYRDIFATCAEKIETLSMKNEQEDGKITNIELSDYIKLIEKFIEESDIKDNNVRLYYTIKMELEDTYDKLQKELIRLDMIQLENDSNVIEVLSKQYLQLSLDVKENMSKEKLYNDIVKKGKVIPLNNNHYITSKKDCLYTVEVDGQMVQAILINERSDFERMIQVLVHKCEPIPIGKEISSVSIGAIISFKRMKQYYQEFLKTGKNDWEEAYKSNYKNYTNAMILMYNTKFNIEYSEEFCVSEEEFEANKNYIQVGQNFAKFIFMKRKIVFANKTLKEVIADYAGCRFSFKQYDRNIALKLIENRITKDKKINLDVAKEYIELLIKHGNHVKIGNAKNLSDLHVVINHLIDSRLFGKEVVYEI